MNEIGWQDYLLQLEQDVDELKAERDRCRAALEEIAEMSGEDPERHYLDEWTEAEAFNCCREIARAALRGEGASDAQQ